MKYVVHIPILDIVAVSVEAHDAMDAMAIASDELQERFNTLGFPDWLSPTIDHFGIDAFEED